MSAETLRKAAALMRERAEAASPGPWRMEHNRNGRGYVAVAAPGTYRNKVAWKEATPRSFPDFEHVASWHPAVALAVADWLEETAAFWDTDRSLLTVSAHNKQQKALAVATAYLGEATA